MTQSPKKQLHGGKRRGAGRKPKYDNPVMIAARVPAKLRDKLDRFSPADDRLSLAALGLLQVGDGIHVHVALLLSPSDTPLDCPAVVSFRATRQSHIVKPL